MTKKELEKENAELKQLVEWLDVAIDSDIPIADKLAELEKENVRMKKEIKNNEDLATVAYMQGADSQKKKAEKQLIKAKELEKENAELKEKVGKYQIGMFDEIEKRDKRLTKAEEILREYIRINLLPPTERNFDDEVKLFKEAEQFLN